MTEPKDRPLATSTTSDNEPDELPSKNQAVTNVISKSNGPGLIDLPAEVRIMIFRHLLVSPHDLRPFRWPLEPQKSLGILNTNRLIHGEAFGVLYGENIFADPFWTPNTSVNLSARVTKSLQHIHVYTMVLKGDPAKSSSIPKFLKLIHHFGDQSIIRGSLTVEFYVDGPLVGLLKWYVRALGRFTNFRMIELYFDDRMFDHPRDGPLLLKYLQTALEPVLGCAESYETVISAKYKKKGLRFHPVTHPDLWRSPEHGDWADFLDGIRLEWDEI